MAIRLRAWLCCTTLFALMALSLASCGSSSQTPLASSTTSAVAGGAPTAPATSDSSGSAHRLSAGRDIVHTGTAVQRPVHGTGGNAINDDNPSRADSGTRSATGPNPCALVSREEAQAIVGAPIATPQEAPLGPTCIYGRRGGGDLITVAVESLEFAKIKPKIHDTIRAILAGRTAYCGDYGRPTTFVPLAHGMVLNVSAPCAVGVRFAEKALRRLGKSL